jgi:hypothetical protein
MTTIFISPHKKIGYFFTVLTIIALLLTIYGLLQKSYRADIVVYSQRTKTEINITDTVPAKILEQTLSGNQTYTPKTIATMDDFASGEVTIINNSSQGQRLVANTRLLSADKKLFRLTQQIVVPANQKVVAQVKADKTGAEYEIPATTFIFPGLSSILQKKIYAQSSQPMIGGFKKIGLITQKDIDDAVSQLKSNLQKQALDNLEKQNNDSSLKMALNSSVTQTSIDAKAGDEKESFNVILTMKFTAALIKEEDLLKEINAQLTKKIPDDQKLASIDQSSFAYRLNSADTEAGTATIAMYISGETILSEKNNLLAKVYFINKTKDEIQAYLQGVGGIEKSKINFSPFFIKKSPNNENRINLKVI